LYNKNTKFKKYSPFFLENKTSQEFYFVRMGILPQFVTRSAIPAFRPPPSGEVWPPFLTFLWGFYTPHTPVVPALLGACHCKSMFIYRLAENQSKQAEPLKHVMCLDIGLHIRRQRSSPAYKYSDNNIRKMRFLSACGFFHILLPADDFLRKRKLALLFFEEFEGSNLESGIVSFLHAWFPPFCTFVQQIVKV
jgi:hypothetical protein